MSRGSRAQDGWLRPLALTTARLVGLFSLLLLLTPVASRALNLGAGELAYESDQSGNWDIYLLDLSTGLRRNLTRSAWNERTPAWSPDGSQLLFYADSDADMDGEIYRLAWAGGEAERLAVSAGNNWRPVWSPDGQWIVFLRDFGRIRVVDLDGGNERALGFGFSPSWSADSRYVLYYSNRDNDLNSDVYAVSLTGSFQRNLTNHRANDWSPAWSPDGRYILFVSARDGNGEIYRMEAACVQSAAPSQTCGQTTTRLTQNDTNDNMPAWSPDGARIAYVSEREGYSDLYVMDADGGNLRRVTDGDAYYQFPAWRP